MIPPSLCLLEFVQESGENVSVLILRFCFIDFLILKLTVIRGVFVCKMISKYFVATVYTTRTKDKISSKTIVLTFLLLSLHEVFLGDLVVSEPSHDFLLKRNNSW